MPNTDRKTYFDLKKYFESEVQKLKQKHQLVEKTAQSGEKLEVKKLSIKNWQQELSVFSEADINKSSWIGLFEVDSNATQITYTSTKKEIPVKKIEIFRNTKQEIKHIHLVLSEDNVLYHSKDTLDYYPDSLYQIHKWQKTKFLNESNYWIKGLFYSLNN